MYVSCNNVEEKLLKEASTKVQNSTAREQNNGKNDSLNYYLNLDIPTRDVVAYLKNGGKLPNTKFYRDYKPLMQKGKNISSSETQNYCEGGIFVFQYPGVSCDDGSTSSSRMQSSTNSRSNLLNCFCYPPLSDPWNNKIHAIASYGNDDRQGYYVYLPNNFSINSKIVVLIHGGGWTSGPDMDQINGWGSTYTATNPSQNNIVKNLLTQGYVVVSLLYRLVHYGDNNTEIVANPTSIHEQIDDIENAITHIHTNFPSCLGIAANNIQVLGESAGAHLALMYAYTRADTSYVRSVLSVAGPTNMSQMANWVMTPPFSYSCGSDFVFSNPNTANPTHFPFYGIYDPSLNLVNCVTTAFVNPLTCNVAGIKSHWLLPAIAPYTAPYNVNKRITNSYRLAQSCVNQIISNPLTNIAFQNISPCSTLVASRIVPTFIIHGTDDWIVPYTRATNGMDTRLTNTGGLIGTYNSNGTGMGATIPASSFYSTSNNRHIIKLFTNANHDVSNHPQTQTNILTWLNGH